MRVQPRDSSEREPGVGAGCSVSRAASRSCGIDAVISGNDIVANAVVSFSDPAGRIDPGDIVVMHFDSNFPINFVTALRAVKAAGLTPALLENWINVS